MKAMSLILGIATILAVQGCYLPPVWDIGDEINYVHTVIVGETTKQQVIDKVGEPHWKNEPKNIFFYSGQQSYGLIVVMCGAMDCLGGLMGEETWRFSIHFDDNDIVSRVSLSGQTEPQDD